VRLSAELVPVRFGDVDVVVPGRSLDVGECLVPLAVGDVADLVEAGQGVADVRCVGQWLVSLEGSPGDGWRSRTVASGGAPVAAVFG
jgi:hypothetical protein